MNYLKTAKTLTYLGIVPFLTSLVLAIVAFLNDSLLPDNLAWVVAHSYGVIILSFLAGIQWGVSLPATQTHNYFILSNVFSLLAWLTFLDFAGLYGMSGLFFLFGLVLMTDRKMANQQLIPNWFWHLRKVATAWVMTVLFLLLALKLF